MPNAVASNYVDLGAHELPVPTIGFYCAGDGFLIQCPCGNNSVFLGNEGCLNSLGLGAVLLGGGSARITNDTVVLTGTQMPSGPCLYFQGDSQAGGGVGVTFGDGLLCVAGSILRLGIVSNVGGSSQFPSGGPTLSAAGLVTTPGSVRNYQIWYRDAAAFCTSATNNLSSAATITWEL